MWATKTFHSVVIIKRMRSKKFSAHNLPKQRRRQCRFQCRVTIHQLENLRIFFSRSLRTVQASAGRQDADDERFSGSFFFCIHPSLHCMSSLPLLPKNRKIGCKSLFIVIAGNHHVRRNVWEKKWTNERTEIPTVRGIRLLPSVVLSKHSLLSLSLQAAATTTKTLGSIWQMPVWWMSQGCWAVVVDRSI